MLDPKRQDEILQRWNHSVRRRTWYSKKSCHLLTNMSRMMVCKISFSFNSEDNRSYSSYEPINWKLISTLGSRTKSLSCPSGVNFPICSKIYQPLVEEAWSQRPSLQSWDGSHKGHGSSSLYPSPLNTKGMDPNPKAEQFVLIITTFW